MQKKITIIILLGFLVQCIPWMPNAHFSFSPASELLFDVRMPLASIAIFQAAAKNALVIFETKNELQDATAYAAMDQQAMRYRQAQQYCDRFRINLFIFFLNHPAQNLPPPDSTVIA